jgi:hypothetical protein
VQKLREHLAAFDEPSIGRAQRAATPHKRRQILRAPT